MRLALFQIGQETDTFNPSPTTMRRLRGLRPLRGPGDPRKPARQRDRRRVHRRRSRRSGARHRDRAAHARLGGSGRADHDRGAPLLRGPAARGTWSPPGAIDGLAMHLHGACSAEGVDDVEGRLLGDLPRGPRGRRADRPDHRPPRQRDPGDGRPAATRSSATGRSRTIRFRPARHRPSLLIRIARRRGDARRPPGASCG